MQQHATLLASNVVFNLSYISCFNYIESVMQKLCQPIYKKFKRNLITILILIIIPENISAFPAENKKKKAWTLHTVCSYLLTLINPLVKNTIQMLKGDWVLWQFERCRF